MRRQKSCGNKPFFVPAIPLVFDDGLTYLEQLSKLWKELRENEIEDVRVEQNAIQVRFIFEMKDGSEIETEWINIVGGRVKEYKHSIVFNNGDTDYPVSYSAVVINSVPDEMNETEIRKAFEETRVCDATGTESEIKWSFVKWNGENWKAYNYTGYPDAQSDSWATIEAEGTFTDTVEEI